MGKQLWEYVCNHRRFLYWKLKTVNNHACKITRILKNNFKDFSWRATITSLDQSKERRHKNVLLILPPSMSQMNWKVHIQFLRIGLTTLTELQNTIYPYITTTLSHKIRRHIVSQYENSKRLSSQEMVLECKWSQENHKKKNKTPTWV